ncbi:MAG TPA: 16S rRNA (adenine(1518)-N(6)/adenine(1519)-N(6))-dimethyltransferase RsmA [Acidobacteriaceae bacterium]|jgi:16S rRNA (adenine1518-N6/adenine1519-N6)-dimethyltransferase|nr:16S rRNA (adenine(1518)-N(6)/adenine(1519)-N(6))-dimethyltransferase RsmA [Acidobacteriaceae bacterium]
MSPRPAHPKLGQNFLVDLAAQSAIVEALGDLTHRTVVEIGPGQGAITALLARRAQRLIAIELDRELAPRLRDHFAGQPNVEIREQDILATDFADPDFADPSFAAPAFAAPAPSDGLLIIGNLPYYITSDILLHLFAAHHHIERAVIMVQREVADRVAAHPGTRDYGLLSATAQLYARVENLFTLPPSAFAPPPQVHSTVLRLTIAPRFQELGLDEPHRAPASTEGFIAFLKLGFAQKRKMLAKNLRTAGYDPAKIAAAFAANNLNPQSRAEELDLNAMASLFHHLCDQS